jgi:succinate dehydrogenase/fumarate reductase flavoprotein subunit
MKRLIILAAVVVAGCGTAPPVAHHRAAPSPVTMTLLRACQVLRSDMVAAQVQDVALVTDAQKAEADVGNSNLWWIDAALMAHDCRPSGVSIPTLSSR